MARVFDYIPKFHFSDAEKNQILKEGLQDGEMWILVQDRYRGNWNHVLTRYCPAVPLEELTPQWCKEFAAEAERLSEHVPIRLEIHPDKTHQVVFLVNENCFRLFTMRGGNQWTATLEIKDGVVCDDLTALRRRGLHPYMAELEDQENLPPLPSLSTGGLYLNGWEQIIPAKALDKAAAILKEIEGLRNDGEEIYPPQDMVFRALKLTPPERVKVVILGQDPYHGPGEACGLSFSVQDGVKIPPSLKNIFKVLQADLSLPKDKIPKNGDLTAWAEHGVLLLNTLLTVSKGKPMSHAKYGWQDFTGAIIEACSKLPQPVVFLLWGAEAVIFSTRKHVQETASKHIIVSSHPSPLAANRGSPRLPAFMQSHPFLEANSWLVTHGGSPVNWRLD